MKLQKLIWDNRQSSFARDLQKALEDGWKIVPTTLVSTLMESAGSLDERYFAIVEKE